MSSSYSDGQILDILKEAASAVADALGHLEDWGPTGVVRGQYRCDLAADQAAVSVIRRAGLGVVSEESGVHDPANPVVVVLDPVDGSTNASQGIPWYATSLCAVDLEGLRAAVVVNQANGRVYEATRGGGAYRDGDPLKPSGKVRLGEAIVGFCGVPRSYFGWNQARVLGAAALDICAVAEGVLDAYVDATGGSLAPWDYLGALLICREAGALAAEASGRELVTTEHSARTGPIVAATPELLAEITAALAR